MQESDSTTSTTFTDIVGGGFTTTTTATGNNGPQSIYFSTVRRYVRLLPVTDSATTAATYAAYLIGDARAV